MNPATRQLILKAFGFNGGLGSELHERTVGSFMFAGAVAGAYLGFNYDELNRDPYECTQLNIMRGFLGGVSGGLSSVMLCYAIPHMHPVTVPVCVAGVLVANRIKRSYNQGTGKR